VDSRISAALERFALGNRTVSYFLGEGILPENLMELHRRLLALHEDGFQSLCWYAGV
jgi:hypothetical protein